MMHSITRFPEEATQIKHEAVASRSRHVKSRSMEMRGAREGDNLTKNRNTRSHHVQVRRYNLRSMSVGRDAGKLEVQHAQWQVEILDSLNLLLAPHYVTLAFSLPPGSDTIWASIEEDIMCHCDADCPPSNIEDLASFLLLFFSPQFVAFVKGNLICLANSFLGIDYTLRLGKASLARRILEDLMHEHIYTKEGPLAGFLGDSLDLGIEAGDADNGGTKSGEDHAARGWQEARKKKGRRSSQPQESGSGNQTGRGGGSGRGGGGRRGRGGRGGEGVAHFTGLQLIVVSLPAYKTPPKAPHQAWAIQRQRELSIGERSHLFWDHPLVEKSAPYNPQVASLGRAHLFHGTRASSLDGIHGFRTKGIKPQYKANEFCAEEAFYLSNSVRHAYEHPLHHHPARNSDDPIAVFVFDLDIEVLHGNKCPPGQDEVFVVAWFEEPNRDWEEYCRGNMNKHLARDDAEIVIGPICKVKPAHQKYEALKVELEGGVHLVQVAFCCKRAWRWLETCATLMYLEKRSNP